MSQAEMDRMLWLVPSILPGQVRFAMSVALKLEQMRPVSAGTIPATEWFIACCKLRMHRVRRAT